MTIWRPAIEGSGGPRYRAIVDALHRDIESGRLRDGDRLPTHRDLADTLGVTVGTVTRAYREAIDRGLVSGEVGRGTFVRASRHPEPPGLSVPEQTEPGVIDFSLNFMRLPQQASAVARTLRALAESPEADVLFEEYTPQAGLRRHREAGARWVARAGVHTHADQVLITAGAQHAMTVLLLGLTRPGDVVLTGAVTYPTMLGLGRILERHLRGIAMDQHGILPDALDAACRTHHPKLLYCMPNVQNPTTRVMPLVRRRELAEVITRHGIAILEDDVYGFQIESPLPPLSSMVERGYYLTSCSKSIAPGLRVGYLVVPRGQVARLLDALWATTLMAAPPMAEIAARWIEDGTADTLVAARRNEGAARQQLARDHLQEWSYEAHPTSFHLWLKLPPTWRSASFVSRAQQRGVSVIPGESFAVAELPEPAVRLSLGAARSRAEVERGLTTLASLLRGSDAPRVV